MVITIYRGDHLVHLEERQTDVIIGRGLSHPTRSLSKIVCRGQEDPIVSKGILRPDFQANTRP
jgi:hypothetical protein